MANPVSEEAMIQWRDELQMRLNALNQEQTDIETPDPCCQLVPRCSQRRAAKRRTGSSSETRTQTPPYTERSQSTEG
jgi:hypothetical protein